MKATSRKLRELENNILDFEVEDGSTILSPQCMSANEIELHNKAGKLLELRRYFAKELYKKLESDPEADVSEIARLFNDREKAIVDASQRMYLLRALDVMNMALFQYIHFNEPMQKALFYMRFRWFLDEMQDWLWLSYLEQRIIDDDSLCEGEKEKLLQKQVYNHWREWLTKESFQDWMKKNDGSLFKRLEDFTPEEMEEMNRKDAEYEAKYKAEDEAVIKGKCASCKEKCSWYHETIRDLDL